MVPEVRQTRGSVLDAADCIVGGYSAILRGLLFAAYAEVHVYSGKVGLVAERRVRQTVVGSGPLCFECWPFSSASCR